MRAAFAFLAILAVASATTMTLNSDKVGELLGAYEKPSASGTCSSGEEAVQITGVSGSFCSPSCPCPAAPSGTTAKPECVLEKPGSSSPTQCALICQPGSGNGGCPSGATCQPISGIGICTYAASGLRAY